MAPSLTTTLLGPLPRADGSATYFHAGYSIACGINGPIEVQRKDELPEQATIDVVVRPAYGAGGIRERWFEDIVKKTLRNVILVDAHPRALVQVTLQVVATPREEDVLGGLAQADSNLPILPALLQASMLALLSTSIPLSRTLTSTSIAVDSSSRLVQDPSIQQLREAESVHVLAFSSHGDLLVVESEGEFDIDIWEAVVHKAKQICRGDKNDDDDNDEDQNMNIDSEERRTLEDTLRDTIREKVVREQLWKENLG